MRVWGKFLVAAAAPLMVGGCLWGPGKFTSDLALRKNGTFVLDYRGEIMLQIPDELNADPKPIPWNDQLLRCFKDGRVEFAPALIFDGPVTDENSPKPMPRKLAEDERQCTPAELAKGKSDYERKTAEAATHQREEDAKMAKLFGMPGSDDASNRRFAANLMKYQGWRSVSYKGKGLFDVDYHFEGRIGQDYVFPVMPDSDIIVPFVTIRRRTDGAVMVTAPALTGGQGPFSARAKMLNLPDKGDGPPSRAEGRFTITTDGEILTNNSEDGPVTGPGGKSVRWEVNPGTNKIPEMLVRL